MFRRFTRRTWMLIGGSLVAVAVVVALALTVGGGEADDGDVATGTSTTVAPTTAPASPTTEDTATTTGGATTTAPCTDPTPDGEVLAEVDLDGDGSAEVVVGTGSLEVREFTGSEDPLDPGTDTGDPIATDTVTGRRVK